MKVVFLDIDGVLQPIDTKDRFYEIDNNARKLVRDLSQKYQVDYSQYIIYDILMTYYDWHKGAVERLKSVLKETNSKIIISSDWRSNKFPKKMHDLLKIHGLDKYYYCDNILIKDKLSFDDGRYKEIMDSLNRYSIEKFVVLDDRKELKRYFPENSVITFNYMSIGDMNDAIKILKKTR